MLALYRDCSSRCLHGKGSPCRCISTMHLPGAQYARIVRAGSGRPEQCPTTPLPTSPYGILARILSISPDE